MTQPNIDNILSSLNRFITLPQLDRSSYASDFSLIRDELIKKLRDSDEVFNKLYNGTCMAGSYADNLKISKPNEYDLIIRLKMSENSKLKIIRDKNKPGYVQINMADAMEKIRKETQNKIIYDRFEEFVDSNRFLKENEIQRWFTSIITKILNKCNYTINGATKNYKIKYSIHGPAHTFTINEPKFSIDFVPAFVFDKSQWLAETNYPNIKREELEWFAVPKPIKIKHQTNEPNISFITSYNITERILIKNRNNLKNTLKILKKLRDRQNIQNMKSYFIKTIYLWENSVQTEDFWKQSCTIILLHMFNKLLDCIKLGEIQFFWDKKQNMLADFDENQRKSMYGQFKKAYDNILKFHDNPEKIYQIFLTPDEKDAVLLNNDSIDSIDKEFELINLGETYSNSKVVVRDPFPIIRCNSILDEPNPGIEWDLISNNSNSNIQLHQNNSVNCLLEIWPVRENLHSKKVLTTIQNILNNTNQLDHDKIITILKECKKYESQNHRKNDDE